MKYQTATFVFTHTDGTPLDETKLQICCDLTADMAAGAGFEAFEQQEQTLKAYVQEDLFDCTMLNSMLEAFPIEDVKVEYTMAESEDRNWNEVWEETGFEPIVIDSRLVVHDTINPYTGNTMPIDITIEPRQAFGTGTHETTRMILRRMLDMQLQDKRVLDCGCGTGILSIAARKMGASDVVGYDIDEWSVDNTEHNALLNNVEVGVFLGDKGVLSHISGVFDVVIANINRNILLADMEAMADVMSANARLLLSGFYEEDAAMLEEKAQSLGMYRTWKDTDGNWCCLEFSK